MLKTPWRSSRCLRGIYRRPWSIECRWRSSAPDDSDLISPALLGRARALAEEHASITSRLATDFDLQAAKKLGDLRAPKEAYGSYIHLQSALSELQTLLQDPKTDSELRTLAQDDLQPAQTALQAAAATLKSSLVPPHPFAHLPCYIELRPGAGGSEAALFAGDLLRMYTAYCNRHGLRCTILKYEDADGASDPKGSDAPLQEAVLEVSNPSAYGQLRCEAGVHRVQRVPATESKGRTHTSAVSVMVLPSFPEDGSEGDNIDPEDKTSLYYIDPKEVRTDIMRARGAGGQHVNTTESAVRLTHLPSGTVVAIQDSRSQPKNKAKAWSLLRSRVAAQRREAKEEEMLALRRSVVGVAKTGRGDKVRTYNWNQQRCTDHRSGLSVHDLDDVLEGGEELDKVMDSVRAWLAEQDVLSLAEE